MQRRIIINKGKKYIVNVVGWDDGVWDEPTSSVAPPTPSFSPTDLPNLVGWYCACNVTGSGGPITVDNTLVDGWLDISGQGHNLYAPGPTTRPIFKTNILNGQPVVRFDGTSDFLQAVSIINIAQPVRFYLVYKQSSIGTYQCFFDGNTSRMFFASYFAGAPGHQVWDMWTAVGGSDVNIGVQDDLNWHITTLVYSGSTSQFAFDSKSLNTTPGNPGTGQWDGFEYLGATRAGVQYFAADIAEILVYSGSMDATDHGNVVDYLATKYALTVAA